MDSPKHLRHPWRAGFRSYSFLRPSNSGGSKPSIAVFSNQSYTIFTTHTSKTITKINMTGLWNGSIRDYPTFRSGYLRNARRGYVPRSVLFATSHLLLEFQEASTQR